MPSGKLEVFLVDAQDLDDKRLFGKMSTYVRVQYEDQEQKSVVAKRQGTKPAWNSKLSFDVKYPRGDEHKYKLILTIMDHHKFGCGPWSGIGEAHVGQTTIYVKDVVSLGIENGGFELQRTKYRVVLPDKTYAGEISVSLKFTSNTQNN